MATLDEMIADADAAANMEPSAWASTPRAKALCRCPSHVRELAARWEALIAHVRSERDRYAEVVSPKAALSDPVAAVRGVAATAFVAAYNDVLAAAGESGDGGGEHGPR